MITDVSNNKNYQNLINAHRNDDNASVRKYTKLYYNGLTNFINDATEKIKENNIKLESLKEPQKPTNKEYRKLINLYRETQACVHLIIKAKKEYRELLKINKDKKKEIKYW